MIDSAPVPITHIDIMSLISAIPVDCFMKKFLVPYMLAPRPHTLEYFQMASGSGGLRELGRAYRSGNLLPSNALAASARLQRLTSHLNIFITECTENAQSAPEGTPETPT